MTEVLYNVDCWHCSVLSAQLCINLWLSARNRKLFLNTITLCGTIQCRALPYMAHHTKPWARAQWRNIHSYFHLRKEQEDLSIIQRLFWPTGGGKGVLLSLSLLNLTAQAAHPNESCGVPVSLPGSCLLSPLCNAQWRLFIRSVPKPSRTPRITQRPGCSPEINPPRGLEVTF